jgi:uncharacterized protein
MPTDRYIPGVPCWVDTCHPDPEGAAAFYGGLLGWECEDTMPPGSPGAYIMGCIRGEDVAAVGSVPAGAPDTAGWNTYVWVTSADETTATAVAAGAAVVTGPVDVFDAGRMAMLADPEGAVFGVWEPRQHRGAQVVNEHGSLNFNDLHTRDPQRAARFYGTVFGWEVVDIGGEPMWSLPGYGEFLDKLNPGTLANMAEMGAPPGFENVVASIAPIPADDPQCGAHWGVTFAVDDADATAKLAVELGGRLVAGPIDAPWVRFAVIADPQGAEFTASQYVPENAT